MTVRYEFLALFFVIQKESLFCNMFNDTHNEDSF